MGGGCPPQRWDGIAFGQQWMMNGLGADVFPIAPLQPLLRNADTVLFHASGYSSGRSPVYPALPVSRRFELLIFQIETVKFMHADKPIHLIANRQRVGNYILVIDHQAVGAGHRERSARLQTLVHI